MAKKQLQNKAPNPNIKTPKSSVQRKPWPIIVSSLLVLTLITYWIFSPAFDNQFVNWDDQVYVEEQPMVLNKEYTKLWKTPVSLNYHPITMISLALQSPNKGKAISPRPFIVANVWFHILNSMLVFLLLWLINDKKWQVALFAAMVFAWHPMHVESVVWVSERKDVLYTFFFLISCIFYSRYLDGQSKRWLVLTFLFFILSVLSKAMAVVLPVVMLLMDYWKDRKLNAPAAWIEKIPFFAVSVFFGLMAISVQGGGDFGGLLTLFGEKSTALAAQDVFTIWQRMQFASFGFIQYIIKFFSPTSLSAFYPYPAEPMWSGASGLSYLITFLVVIGASIWSMRKTKILFFSIGFYFVTIALVLQFLSVGLAIMADRYTYIPYIGIAFLLANVTDQWISHKTKFYSYAVIGVGAIFLILLMNITRSQVDVWQNSESLWTHALKYYPNEDLVLANRGNHRGKTGNIQGAITDFEAALADGCERSDVYEGLGNSYGTLSAEMPEKREAYVAKAIEMFQIALTKNPEQGNVHFNLGIAQLQTNPTESVKAFSEALRLMPYKEVDILPVLGMAYLNSGNYQQALATTTKAIQLGVNTDEVYLHRGLASIGLSMNDAAKADFTKALSINPNNEMAKSRLNSLR